MRVEEFELFQKEEEGYYSVLKVIVTMHDHETEYMVERLHTPEEITHIGWDGDIDWLKKLVGGEMRRQVMSYIERDLFKEQA